MRCTRIKGLLRARTTKVGTIQPIQRKQKMRDFNITKKC